MRAMTRHAIRRGGLSLVIVAGLACSGGGSGSVPDGGGSAGASGTAGGGTAGGGGSQAGGTTGGGGSAAGGTTGGGGSAAGGTTGGGGTAAGGSAAGGTIGRGGTGGGAGSTAGRGGGTGGSTAGNGGGGGAGGRGGAGTGGGVVPSMAQETVIPRLTGCDAAQPYPHDPAVDESNGIVYYVDSDNSCVGRYDPSTGQFTAWATPTASSRPHGLTVASNGHVFYTGQRANLLGRLNPAVGITNEYPAGTDPHTPLFHMSMIWFTAQSGNRYGRLNPADGSLMTWPAPTANSQPYGIQPAPNGHLFIALFGTNKLAELDPANPATLVEHVLPNAGSRVRRLAVDAQGRVWYGDYARDRLGMFDPATKQFREWTTASTAGLPYSIVIGPDDRVWYNDDGASMMVAFDPVTEQSQIVMIPTRGSTVRNVAVDRTRRRIWLAESGVGRIGLIQL
jgi:virginiamycin B lyase